VKFFKYINDIFSHFLILWPGSYGMKIRYRKYKNLFTSCGDSIYIGQNVSILGFENICLGNGINIMANSYLYAHDNGSLMIGNDFAVNHGVYIGASGGKIKIGDNVCIGPYTVLRAMDHGHDRTDIPMTKQGDIGGEICIEDDVWIGANCTILKNVKIGKGAIVAAGCVVTKDIPSYAIAAGVPNRVIKSRLD